MQNNQDSFDDMRQFVGDIDSELAADLEDTLDGQAAETAKIVQLKALINQAEEAGLDDDPAVEQLSEHVTRLEQKAGFGPDRTDPERMGEELDLDEDALARVPEDTREMIRNHIEFLDERSGISGPLAEREIRRRGEEIKTELANVGLEPSELVSDDSPKDRTELAEALEVDDGQMCEAALANAYGRPRSDREQLAQLHDKRDEVEETLQETESSYARLTLTDELETIEERIAEEGGDTAELSQVSESDDIDESSGHPLAK